MGIYNTFCTHDLSWTHIYISCMNSCSRIQMQFEQFLKLCVPHVAMGHHALWRDTNGIAWHLRPHCRATSPANLPPQTRFSHILRYMHPLELLAAPQLRRLVALELVHLLALQNRMFGGSFWRGNDLISRWIHWRRQHICRVVVVNVIETWMILILDG